MKSETESLLRKVKGEGSRSKRAKGVKRGFAPRPSEKGDKISRVK
jgi:hypothetical protein